MKKKIGIIGILVVAAMMLSAMSTVSANIPPIADADPDYQVAFVGETVYFWGWNSTDPDGYIVTCWWTFGDGGYDWNNFTSHEYTSPGLYNVTLTVWDNENATDTDIVQVNILGNTTSPYIYQTVPYHNQTDVSLSHYIYIGFSEAMNFSTFTYTITPDPGGWLWNSSTSWIMGTHIDFNYSTTYWFEVTYIEDLDGNPLVPGPVPNPWCFHTGSAPDDPPYIEVIEPGSTPGQEYYQGDNVTIFWDADDDNPLPPNPIDIFYGESSYCSITMNITWIQIEDDYPNYEIYDWDTTGVPYGNYCIKISVVDSIGQTSYDLSTYTFEITCKDCPPGAPELVSAVLTGTNNEDVKITWELSSDDGAGENDVVKYEVYYSTSYAKDGSGYTLLATLAPGTTTYTHADAGDGDPNNYFYYVQVEDAAGQTAWEGQAGKYIQFLSGGLRHMVSIPLIQADTALPQVIKTLTGSYHQIMLYQGTCANRQWQVYKPGWSKSLYINHKMSFFIKMRLDDYLVVAGLVPESTTITLCQGAWNLIGYPSFTPNTVGNVLAGISYKGVKVITTSRPQHMIHLGSSDIMSAGYGYWIKVLTQQTLVIYN